MPIIKVWVFSLITSGAFQYICASQGDARGSSPDLASFLEVVDSLYFDSTVLTESRADPAEGGYVVTTNHSQTNPSSEEVHAQKESSPLHLTERSQTTTPPSDSHDSSTLRAPSTLSFHLACASIAYASLAGYIWNLSRTLKNSSFTPQLSYLEGTAPTVRSRPLDSEQALEQILENNSDDANGDTCTHSALRKFMEETENELASLRRFRMLVKLLERTYVSRFFYYDRKLVKAAPERIEKLQVMRELAALRLQEAAPSAE